MGEEPGRPGAVGALLPAQQMFRPGEKVPQSGTYECTCGQSHQVFTSTDVRGHAFPPPPNGCSGIGWNLKEAIHE
jgi:hypothetical protein